MANSVPFYKMHGCGNDFVFIDNREVRTPLSAMDAWAKALCAPHTGIGADGLVFLDSTPEGRSEDYIWHFYNADGSRGEMCGNASRCAALLAVRLGLAGICHTLGTDAGPVRAEVDTATQQAKVQLPKVHGLSLNIALELEGQPFTVHHANTGVPHALVLLDSEQALKALDLPRLGAALRYHPHFAPAGTNANFAWVSGPNTIMLRTYERGVEAETQACGTGAAATTFLAHALALTGPQVRVQTSGGELLGISVEGDTCFMSGKAVTVFTGQLDLSAVL